jgi:aminoglycoside phosphotransferase (APT) family kinase protein
MAPEDRSIPRPAIDDELVRRLVSAQFPQWAHLPLRRLEPAGSDHVIYRLGEALCVRLPRHNGLALAARKTAEWLPRLAPLLPLAIPVHVAMGRPEVGYPLPWSVLSWLPGEVATSVSDLGTSTGTALALAEFLVALQRISTSDLPPDDLTADLVGERSLAARDVATRAAIDEVAGVFPTADLTELWDAAMRAPGWKRPPVWFHGDLHAGNLLAREGRISAVIDFGAIGVGDPACDVAVAFGLMSAGIRSVFRSALDCDDATWTRARGWAVAGGLNAYISYAAIDARIAAQTSRQIMDALQG